MTFIVFFLLGLALVISCSNLLLMRKPSGSAAVNFEVLVPARNEADNLPSLLPQLIRAGVPVTVFDDDSSDETASIAAQLGARVIYGRDALPAGWVGKNRACHELANVGKAEWVVFLDADTIPSPEFASRLSSALAASTVPVITGMPRMLPGRGLEPAYLGWVPWILLATNPFGLVSQTRHGHNRMTNGQFVAWKLDTLLSVKPHELLKGEVLEDIKIGRLLAARGIPVEVLNMTSVLSVRMYRTLREAFDGMSKNSAEIAGSTWGSVLLALMFLLYGWGWLLAGSSWWIALAMLVVSKFITDIASGSPLWTFPLMPLTCTGAAITIVRSIVWRSRGKMRWKGREYDTRKT